MYKRIYALIDITFLQKKNVFLYKSNLVVKTKQIDTIKEKALCDGSVTTATRPFIVDASLYPLK